MDPHPNWICIQQLCRSRSVFRMRIQNNTTKYTVGQKRLDGLTKTHHLYLIERSLCAIIFVPVPIVLFKDRIPIQIGANFRIRIQSKYNVFSILIHKTACLLSSVAILYYNQCGGSVSFCYGSRSGSRRGKKFVKESDPG